MPQIDFYILSDAGGRLQLACRLAEKAYNQGHKVYIHTSTTTDAERFDDLLWHFKQNSFVPHALHPVVAGDPSPVLIGYAESPPPDTGVLINLHQDVPSFFDRYDRVLEVVDQEPTPLRLSRRRYKFYRDRGLEPNTHNV